MQNNTIDKVIVEDQLKLIQRDINCLIDQDRNLRRQGFNKIKDFIIQKDNLNERIYIFEGYILKNLLKGFEDPIEKHRELTIFIVDSYLQLNPNSFDTKKLIIETIILRLNSMPFPETSEEIRLQLIKLLQKFDIDSFKESHSKLAHMISKCLADNFPEAKKEIAKFAALISNQSQIGDFMGESVKALVNNMHHAHARVRKASVDSLAPILLSRKNGSFLEVALKSLTNLSLDKSSDVRKGAINCAADLLMHFSIQNLNAFENPLLLIVLNGLNDDSKDIQEQTIILLDKIGIKRKQLDEEANL